MAAPTCTFVPFNCSLQKRVQVVFIATIAAPISFASLHNLVRSASVAYGFKNVWSK